MNSTAAAVDVPHNPFNLRLSPALSRNVDEVAALLDVKAVPRALRAGYDIIIEGRRSTALFIMLEGIAIRYKILRDGQRQVLSVLLPGDFAGVPSCFLEHALYSIKTLTPSTVLTLPLTRLARLLATEPHAAAKFLWAFACESAVYAERLISVSRRPAHARVAHFLLELHARLQKLGFADATSFRLPLTQEILSDALGLSIPYVNRVLQQLRAEGLLRIKDHQVVIENSEELAALADFEESYLSPLSLADFALAAA